MGWTNNSSCDLISTDKICALHLQLMNWKHLILPLQLQMPIDVALWSIQLHESLGEPTLCECTFSSFLFCTSHLDDGLPNTDSYDASPPQFPQKGLSESTTDAFRASTIPVTPLGYTPGRSQLDTPSREFLQVCFFFLLLSLCRISPSLHICGLEKIREPLAR